jgi:quercetin dioxygenase-like cupin family protein
MNIRTPPAFTKVAKRMIAVVLGLVASLSVQAQEVPANVVMANAATLQWEDSPVGLRAKIAGDQAKPGPYVFLAKPRAGRSEAHTHPDDRTYTVISGTWYVGFGATFDESKLIALTPGSYYTEPAGVPHFVLIKDEGVVMLITGTGPTKTTLASAPAAHDGMHALSSQQSSATACSGFAPAASVTTKTTRRDFDVAAGNASVTSRAVALHATTGWYSVTTWSCARVSPEFSPALTRLTWPSSSTAQ